MNANRQNKGTREHYYLLEKKIETIIEALRHECYQWKPVWLFQKIA